MQLLYPEALFIAVFFLLCLFFCKQQSKSIPFSNVTLLKKITKKALTLKQILSFLIVLLLSIAIASPIKKQTFPIKKEGIDIVLALDASASMSEDNRFEIAKKTLLSFIKKRKNDKIALVVFANKALVASPLTFNKKALSKILQTLHLGVAGSRDTALYEALYASSKLLEKSKAKSKVIILLTDGINTVNSIPLQAALKKAKKLGIKIYTIGVGKTSDFKKEELLLIAKSTNANFFSTQNPKKLQTIYEKINTLQKSLIENKKIEGKKYYFFYFIFAALVLLTFYFVLEPHLSLIIVAFFLLLALIKPFIGAKEILASSKKIFVAIDVSKIMYAKDLLPNRLSFSLKKCKTLIKENPNTTFSLLAFSKNAYLISPPTNDTKALIYLLKHLNLNNITPSLYPNYLNLLKAIEKIEPKQKKLLLIFSAGNEKQDFSLLQEFAKKHHITILFEQVATQKGAIAIYHNQIVTNKNGDIIYSKAKNNISDFAKVIPFSYDRSDLKTIKKHFISSSIFNQKYIDGGIKVYIAFTALALLIFIVTRIKL